jgi:hypothetical protein
MNTSLRTLARRVSVSLLALISTAPYVGLLVQLRLTA